MSNTKVEAAETSNVDNRRTEESSVCGQPVLSNTSVVTKVEGKKSNENDSDATPKIVNRPPYIPPHLMGRDLNDPAQDMVGTGRRVQKPRLGVKVPYRNLTSQIVSQDEIAQEILERSLRKYSYSEVPEGGDVFFAMKLTHRLANKITTAVDSSNDRAGSSGGISVKSVGGSGSSSDGIVGDATGVTTMKKSETPEITVIRNLMDISTAINDKSKESDRKIDPMAAKKCLTVEKICKTNLDRSSDASRSETCVNFESKADQLYAEISSTLGEECKIGKSLKITSPVVNSHSKIASPKIANGSINQTTTETELDNDTLLAILEGTSDVNDVSPSTATTPSVPKVELVSQSQLAQPQPQQHQRKKRIKPMLDPNVEKELALKQLMDFEKKKNEDRLKKSAAKKLKLNEDTPVVISQLDATIIAGGQCNKSNHISLNNNNNNNNSSDNNENNDNIDAKINNGNNNADGGDNSVASALPRSCVSTGIPTKNVDNSRQDMDSTSPLPVSSKCESTLSGKKVKKSSFSSGSMAPKRFPKKYQRIIKRQLRSSKLKAKTVTPDQQQQLQQSQKKLPEVPEVQIAIDRYIKTYASKRKRKPEVESKVKATPESSPRKSLACETSRTNNCDESAAIVMKSTAVTGVAQIDDRSPDKQLHPVRCTKQDIDVSVNNSESVDARPSSCVDEGIKENGSPTTTKPKANSKVMREINRLLGDEGAINMIYSIEQKRLPDSKRDTNILPSLRRKKKDLLLKTKLVKNAVLRLSMSPGQLSPGRVRRTSPEINTAQTIAANVKSIASPSRKASIESLDSNTSEQSPKARKVAAEASRIIRRHSSSSAYSSDEDENTSAVITTNTTTITTAAVSSTDASSLSSSTSAAAAAAAAAAANQLTLATAKDTSTVDGRTIADTHASKEIKSVESSSDVVENQSNATETKASNSGSNRVNKSTGSCNDNIIEYEKENSMKQTAISEKNGKATTEHEKSTIGASSSSAGAATAGTIPINPTSSNKRRDSKEGTAPSKTFNELSTVSSYSELVERLDLKEITLRKYDNMVQIILISLSCKMKNAVNIQVFNELTNVLNELQKDESCRTVLLTSTGSSFCQGIDLQALIQADTAQRRLIVNEYVAALLSFTKCLSQFKKVLIAGVHGSAVGLGVTMLPFFDMVFASDKATFYTPYVKLGQIPEAGATLTLPHLLGNAVTSELLFGCRMLTAGEALQFGLVTRILWPDKFGEELLPIARSVASNSSQSMEATKSLLRQTMNEKLLPQLNAEAELLQEHWFSDECQRRFKNYLQQEALLQNE